MSSHYMKTTLTEGIYELKHPQIQTIVVALILFTLKFLPKNCAASITQRVFYNLKAIILEKWGVPLPKIILTGKPTMEVT